MKKLYYLIVLTLILGLVLTGCFLSNVGQVPATEQSGIAYLTKANGEPYTETNPFKAALLAGQDEDVGEVQVWNDAENLYVTYLIDASGWYLTETHLHVACDEIDIPQNKKGNPIPGHFEYSSEHEISAEVIKQPFEISLDSIDCCNPFIAAHAVVMHIAEEECIDVYSDITTTFEGITSENSGDAVLAWVHKNWNPGLNYSFTNADWIWESYRTVNPVSGDVVDFTKTFEIPGLYLVDASVEMHVTCDNGYEFLVNGVSQGSAQLGAGWRSSDLTESYVTSDGWQSVESYSGFAGNLKLGTNTLLFQTANEQMSGGTQDSNPGGLIYEGQVCYTVVDQEETAWGFGTRFVDQGNWATFFTYPLQPVTICADFSELAAGDTVEGLGTVAPYLNISTPIDGDAVKIVANTSPAAFGGGNTACGDTSILNGGIADGGGFSNVDALNAVAAHSYTFEFSVPISKFSLHMLDYGDWNPSRASSHLAMMKAYDTDGGDVGYADISYTSDGLGNPRVSSNYGDLLCNNGDALTAPGYPGNWTWIVSGVGITKVELTFPTGYDPGIGFDNLCFTIYECVEVD